MFIGGLVGWLVWGKAWNTTHPAVHGPHLGVLHAQLAAPAPVASAAPAALTTSSSRLARATSAGPALPSAARRCALACTTQARYCSTLSATCSASARYSGSSTSADAAAASNCACAALLACCGAPSATTVFLNSSPSRALVASRRACASPSSRQTRSRVSSTHASRQDHVSSSIAGSSR